MRHRLHPSQTPSVTDAIRHRWWLPNQTRIDSSNIYAHVSFILCIILPSDIHYVVIHVVIHHRRGHIIIIYMIILRISYTIYLPAYTCI